MSRAFTGISIIILLVFVAISCSKSGTTGGSTTGGGGGGGFTVNCATVTNKSFTADVNPIIQATCNVIGCHAAGSTNGPGPLTNFAQVSAASNTIRVAISSGKMPQNSTLTAAQKSSIICWIDNGALNN